MKVFFAQASELVNHRFDAEYHFALKKIELSSPYPKERLSSLACFRTGGTPSTVEPRYWGGDIPWVSAKDFKSFRFVDSEDHITQKAIEDSTTFLVNRPALLMVGRSGILQHSLPVMVVHRPTAINQDIKAFFPDDRVSVDYLGAFFDLFGARLLPLLCKSGATVQSLNSNELMALRIPVPPREVQARIVAELDAAYDAKRRADEKAETLLASIDGIVLDALGIPPLPPPNTSLSARIFTVPARDVVGKTLAPAHYLGKLDFSPSTFDCRPFCEVISIDPPESMPNVLPPYHLVPMDAVSSEYGCIERIETIIDGNMGGYSMFSDGDVIFAKISPCMENGKSAVVTTGLPGVLFGSTEFLVFRPKGKWILPEFLHLLLRMDALRSNAAQNLTGTTGHQRITKEYFRKINIPLPPKRVQEAIVSEVAAIREEAKRLKADAMRALSAAQKRIEAEITG